MGEFRENAQRRIRAQPRDALRIDQDEGVEPIGGKTSLVQQALAKGRLQGSKMKARVAGPPEAAWTGVSHRDP